MMGFSSQQAKVISHLMSFATYINVKEEAAYEFLTCEGDTGSISTAVSVGVSWVLGQNFAQQYVFLLSHLSHTSAAVEIFPSGVVPIPRSPGGEGYPERK